MTQTPQDVAAVLEIAATIARNLEEDTPTLADLGRSLEIMQRALSGLRSLVDMISEDLGARMEDDTVALTGVGRLVRKARWSSTWVDDDARERMFDDTASAIVRRIAIDPMTGEIHPALANAVRETWRLVQESYSLGADPKTGFRKTLDLDPSMYRSRRRTGYSVSVEEETL